MQSSKLFVFKQNILYINSSKPKVERVNTLKTSKKSKLILRFEIHKRLIEAYIQT